MNKKCILFTILLSVIMACSGGSGELPGKPDTDDNGNGDGKKNPNPISFLNPVLGKQLPDPSVIRAKDGFFYLYATQQEYAFMPIYRSSNLTQWSFVGSAFTEKPNWQPDTRVWAPDINYIDGKYVLYYSLGHWNSPKNSCIGVAVSDTPAGPFTDHGKLLDYHTGNMQCIDPCFYEENGKKYLFWGSFGTGSYEGGIRYVELSDDGLTIKPGTMSDKIAGPLVEGIMIHKRGSYYYLFGSTGLCCSEAKSTYRVVVGRSRNLAGPYVGKKGTPMNNNDSYNEVILQSNDLFAGTGHISEILTDDSGNDWFFYHAWQKSKIDKGRQLMLDRMQWSSDGWPYITNTAPSSVSRAPVFKSNEK